MPPKPLNSVKFENFLIGGDAILNPIGIGLILISLLAVVPINNHYKLYKSFHRSVRLGKLSTD
jgi:hypothetical protein